MRLVSIAALLAALPLLAATPARAQTPPAHDKVVVVIMENKSYDQARVHALYRRPDGPAGPRSPTRARWRTPRSPTTSRCSPGTRSGSRATRAWCPARPFRTRISARRARQMERHGPRTARTSPSAGSDGVLGGRQQQHRALYTRKHDPWTYFSNINHLNERPYSELAGVLAAHALPNLHLRRPQQLPQ